MFSEQEIIDIAEVICSNIAEGRSLRSICRDTKNFPSMSIIIKWLADADIKGKDSKYYEFLRQYTHAREIQADTLVDEIIDIADDAANDYSKDNEGNEIVNNEHMQRSRLRIDARKWVAGKQRPKKYSDKTQMEHSGEIKSETTIINKSLTMEELKAEALSRGLPSAIFEE